MSEHSEHSAHSDNKQASIGAIVMLLIIAGLVVLGIGTMNGGDTPSAVGAGVLLFLFGLFAVFSLGKS